MNEIIHPDVPDVGDIVRATYQRGTLTVTVQGVVANVRRVSGARVLESECGAVIYRTDTVKTVVMVKRYRPVEPPLFD